MLKAFDILNLNLNYRNPPLLCSRAVVSRWECGPPQTYACGYCETGAARLSQQIIILYYRVTILLGMIFMGELPGKLQNIQQLIAHLLPPLKRTMKYQLLTFQNAAISAVKQTYSFNNDWIWGSCSENKAQSFGPFDQRSLIGWRRLVNDLVILPLRHHCVAHRHHRQELADFRRCWLKGYTESAGRLSDKV